MYKQIQSIRVICYSLFMLDDYTYGLQLAIEDVYEAKVHVFIYGHACPNSPDWNIDVCLRSLIDG